MRSECEKCERYISAVEKQKRSQRIYGLIKFIAILVFVAVLSIAFHSYIPWINLLLLALL